MAKRKLAKEASEDNSDLSPAPENLDDGAEALSQEENQPAKKRKTAAKPKSKKVKTEVTKEVEAEDSRGPAPSKKRARKVKVEEEEQPVEAAGEDGEKPTPKKRQRKTKEVKQEEAEVDENGEVTEKKVKRKRKTKEEKEAEAMPLAARTVGHKLFVGAHVSSAGGQCIHSPYSVRNIAEVIRFHRRPQCSHEQRTHWRQRLCPVLKVATQMGEPAFTVRAWR